jgi:ABC-2 type transport system permease protein
MTMRNIWLIARREYLERVRTRAFIVMTVLLPALILGAFLLPNLLMNQKSGRTRHLVVVAPERSTAELIRQQLLEIPEEQKKQAHESMGMQRRRPEQISNLIVDVENDTSEGERAALVDKVKKKQLDGLLFITKDDLAAKKISYITNDMASLVGNEEIKASVNQALRRELLKNKGLTDSEVDTALRSVQLETQSPSGKANPLAMFLAIFSMVMILYVTVILYGVNVMRAIIEEKTSRIMEVMLSIAQAKEMMAGKILGVGAVGLTQIVIWTLVALVASTPGLIAGASILKGIVTPNLLVYFGIFFLLGYALYSVLCAAVGSMVNSEQETQQLQFLVMMPMIISVIIMSSVINDPGSALAVAGSIFPLTAPLIMFLRIALEAPPWWQVGFSIGLLIATIYGLLWLCARIYRVGILMYGKKPTLPEIMKWVRYT